MKSLILCLLFAVMVNSQQESALKLEVGANIPPHLTAHQSEFIALPDFMPIIRVEVEGVNYELAYYKQLGTIRYIFTSDKKFMTKNKLQVGMCFNVTKEQVGSTRGGITRGPKTEGEWIPIIGYRSHIITCQSDADGSPTIVSVNDMIAESMVEARILQFMK